MNIERKIRKGRRKKRWIDSIENELYESWCVRSGCRKSRRVEA
jgi:hypothetical protein